MSTSLYRYFDEDGQLLYIGISISAVNRMRDHAVLSGWFKDVASMKVTKYESPAAAKEAEKTAIAKERPIHNVVSNVLAIKDGTAARAKRRTGDTDIEKRIESVRQAVRARLGEQAQIARDLKVSYQWLRKFASGALREPSAIKFAHLEEWLEKH